MVVWDEDAYSIPPEIVEMERVEIQLFTVEQLQLQSLIESGLVEAKDINFATNIANTPKASQTQLKWVKTLLDKLIGEPPPVRYEFKTLFDALTALKKFTTEFLGYPLKLNLATAAAKYPGAIYLVSEKPGLGYVGRVDKDHSVVIPKRCGAIKEALIKFLMDLNNDASKIKIEPSKARPQAVYGVNIVINTPDETLAQQVSRGPFDPQSMNAVLAEYQGDKWRR